MTMDPTLVDLRARLRPYRRRLWLRRVVRDGMRIVAVVAVAELLLAVLARSMPLGWAPLAAVAIALAGLLAVLIDAARIRPTTAETALALDAEQGLRDRLSSALELAALRPDIDAASSAPAALAGRPATPRPTPTLSCDCCAFSVMTRCTPSPRPTRPRSDHAWGGGQRRWPCSRSR